jgi:ribonuclease P protein component
VKRKYRITRANDFKRVRQNGKAYAHPLVVIVVSKEPGDVNRVGIIVGKAVGNAVMRNLAKRRIRSIADEFIQHFNRNAEILIIAKPPIASADFAQIRQALLDGMRKAELLLD